MSTGQKRILCTHKEVPGPLPTNHPLCWEGFSLFFLMPKLSLLTQEISAQLVYFSILLLEDVHTEGHSTPGLL